MRSRIALVVFLGLAVVLQLGAQPGLRGQDASLSTSKDWVFPPRPLKEWADMKEQVESAIRFLRSRQTTSGAVGTSYPVAVTSLAGLAVLGAGHHPLEGEHRDMLQKSLSYLAGVARPVGSGLFIAEEGDGGSRMHGHCYAVLFLCELFGSLPGREDEISGLIRKAVTTIERSQSIEGGWYYYPENPQNLDESSVTVCALQSLRAARNAGFSVDSRRVDEAIRYVRRCQSPRDGSFVYSLSPSVEGRGRTSYALTAAALSTLNAAGIYRSEELRKGLDYFRRALANARSPWHAAEEEHDFYANFYAAQALYQDGGDLWPDWYSKVRAHLLRKQVKTDGRWENRQFGDEYATAMALLILEVPLGYLPIFQR